MVLFPGGKSGKELQESLNIPESIKVRANVYTRATVHANPTAVSQADCSVLRSLPLSWSLSVQLAAAALAVLARYGARCSG